MKANEMKNHEPRGVDCECHRCGLVADAGLAIEDAWVWRYYAPVTRVEVDEVLCLGCQYAMQAYFRRETDPDEHPNLGMITVGCWIDDEYLKHA